MYATSIYTPESHVVYPLSEARKQPAPPMPEGSISVDAVPAAPRQQPMPLMRLAVPIIMVVAIGAVIGLMLMSGRGIHPMMMIFPLMMLVSMAAMFSPPTGDDVDDVRRGYVRHLRTVRTVAIDHGRIQRIALAHKHPDPQTLWSMVGSRRMWEANTADVDDLAVRLGVGSVALCTPLEVAEPTYSEDADPVCAISLRHVQRSVGIVEDAPITMEFAHFTRVGVGGPHAAQHIRALISSLAFSYGPEMLSVEVIGEGFEWVKWLPHTVGQPDRGVAAVRVLILSELDAGMISSEEIDDLIHDGGPQHQGYNIVFDVVTAPDAPTIGRMRQSDIYFDVRDGDIRVPSANGMDTLCRADLLSEQLATITARKMSGYRRPVEITGKRSTRLLPLLGYDNLHQWKTTMWSARRQGRDRLRVPIGLDRQGRPLVIDLKESAQGGDGPHGLLIGATGSGKSELLRTLVVALAATHSPSELNMVLVDFKGGATFLGLEQLPHTAAVITNLAEESVLVERMHAAISGEMNRRQEQLRKAGNFANVDAYNEAAHRAGTEPMPALFIVIDEFSELLAQHPDFAELFVAVGRLGRSLHIHLLLASQRLEEGKLRGLESHLSYRIGLKTFSSAESRQVLGVTDAYTLPSRPGAGYLKRDAEGVLGFHTSYVSGTLEAKELAQPTTTQTPGHNENSAVQPFTLRTLQAQAQGQSADAASSPNDSQHNAQPATRTTLLAAIAEGAQQQAGRRGLRAHCMWLPPLPPRISLGQLIGSTQPNHGGHTDTAEDANTLACTIGIIDRPYHQRQDPFVLDMGSSGGHMALCGGPQSGKTTALRTLVLSIAATHNTSHVRFYIIDFGGGLHDLNSLPHVAGIAGKKDKQRVERIIDEVTGLIDNTQTKTTDPHHTILIVDGWHVLGHDHEHLLDRCARIAADGPSNGIHLVMSTQRWTTVRPVIRDLIHHRIELKLAEPMDSLIDRKAQIALVGAPGRGLTPAGEHMLIAHTSPQDTAHVSSMTQGMPPVPALRVLPTHLSLQEVQAELDAMAARGQAPTPQTNTHWIPLGIGGSDLAPIGWTPHTSPHLLVIGARGCGKSTTLRTIMQGISAIGREQARMIVIDHRRRHLGMLEQDMLAAYCPATSTSTEAIKNLCVTLKSRLPGPDISPEQLRERNWWSGPELYLCIDDADLLEEQLLLPLKEFLPLSADIGLHVVLARKAGGFNRSLFGPLMSELKDQVPDVIVMDADREDGPIFGVKTTTQQPGRAILVTHGHNAGTIHIAQPDTPPNQTEQQS